LFRWSSEIGLIHQENQETTKGEFFEWKDNKTGKPLFTTNKLVSLQGYISRYFWTGASPDRYFKTKLNQKRLCTIMAQVPTIQLNKVYPSFVRLKIIRDGKVEYVVLSSKTYNKAKNKEKAVLTHLETA
jgi:hypothetical protein